MSRNAWRDQVIEDAIDPDLPIVDPHHHIWDVAPVMPYERYIDTDLIADKSNGHNIIATVFVESHSNYRSDGPAAMKPVGETEYIERIAEKALHQGGRAAGICAAIVAHADLTLGAGVADVLDAHAQASSRFTGIRQITPYDVDVPASLAGGAGVLMKPEFRQGIAEVFRRGLSFDAWLLQPQLPEVIDLARAFPEGRFILDHFGGPMAIGRFAADPAASFASWKSDLRELAACENVVVKLGGLNMGLAGVDALARDVPFTSEEMAAAQRDYILTTIDLFGPARSMFEINAPVDTYGGSYGVIWNAFKRIVQDFSSADRALLFKDTAMTTYRIDPALTSL